MDCTTRKEVKNNNVDVEISYGLGTTATVCRDHTGLYLGYLAYVIRGMIDPSILESIACREALSLADDLGGQDLLIASDCSTVVKHIHEASSRNYGGGVKQIRSWQTS